jgi:hypothetical protein
MYPSVPAIPAWLIPVIHDRRRHHHGRRHYHRGRRGINWRRRNDDWRGLANNYPRQRNTDPDIHSNTGLRGRNGPE